MKLFFFHHAGGSSSFFANWKPHLSSLAIVAADLPGRGKNFRQPLIYDFGDAVSFLYENAALELDKKEEYITFGHSLGGSLSFFFALNMINLGYKPPMHMFISSCPAPNHPIARVKKLTKEMSRNELIDRVRCIGGTSEEILDSEELMDFFYPILRSDFMLVDSYKPVLPSAKTAISSPITVLFGNQEENDIIGKADEWEGFTSEAFQKIVFPGNHFYLSSSIPQICSMIKSV